LDVSDAVEITNQHHNTPPGWREEPVGDADRSRIDESGRIPRSSERGEVKVQHSNIRDHSDCGNKLKSVSAYLGVGAGMAEHAIIVLGEGVVTPPWC